MFATFEVIRFDGSTPTKYGVRVEYEACFGQVKEELERMSGVPADRIFLVQLNGPMIKDIASDDSRVRDWSNFLASGTLFGYEIAECRSSAGDGEVGMEVDANAGGDCAAETVHKKVLANGRIPGMLVSQSSHVFFLWLDM
jgi:hypothetical protein